MGWGSCRARRESSVDIRNEFRRRRGVLGEFLRVAVREVLVEALRGETSSRHAIAATSNGDPERGARTGMCMNTNSAVIKDFIEMLYAGSHAKVCAKTGLYGHTKNEAELS